MKNKDQVLLEQAYKQIIEENWKGALVGVALAAANLLGIGGAKADSLENAGIEQTKKITVEDIIPQKEFEEVLNMMRKEVANGNLKNVKQIYEVVKQACNDAVTKVQGRDEMLKIANMDAAALKIWNDAYLGVVKGGLSSMANSITP